MKAFGMFVSWSCEELVWNLYLPSVVNVELCSRAWNLMSPLVISSTRNEATSTTQRLPSQLCNNQHSIRNNENFRAIILTWLQLISFYHCSAQRWGLNACTLWNTECGQNEISPQYCGTLVCRINSDTRLTSITLPVRRGVTKEEGLLNSICLNLVTLVWYVW